MWITNQLQEELFCQVPFAEIGVIVALREQGPTDITTRGRCSVVALLREEEEERGTSRLELERKTDAIGGRGDF